MYSYSVIQWLFIFYFYCFFGWCFESTYVSLKKRKWVNRGFMRGPFLPLYGSGAIMMLVVSMPFQDNIFLVYIAGCLGATALEYVTGVAMEALFKVRYWDYSKNKFNFQGHICLGSSLAWGGLTILMTEVIHKPVEKFVLSIPNTVLTIITLVLTAYIFADFAVSFKAAMDLRDVLVKMEKAKEDMLHIRKRLDVIIALTNEDFANRKEGISENFQLRREAWADHIENRIDGVKEGIDDIKDSIEDRLEGLRELAVARHSEYLEEMHNELAELREKYLRSKIDREHLSALRDFVQRDLIRANPSMSSAKFREALEELKKRAEEKRNKKEK